MYLKSDGIEDAEYHLLLCLSFDIQRQDRLAKSAEFLRQFAKFTNLFNDAPVQLLRYGDWDVSNELNRNIHDLMLCFIHETGRFK